MQWQKMWSPFSFDAYDVKKERKFEEIVRQYQF